MLSFFKRNKKRELPLYNSDIDKPEEEKGFINYLYELKEIIIGK
jgi:hypothetical protein